MEQFLIFKYMEFLIFKYIYLFHIFKYYNNIQSYKFANTFGTSLVQNASTILQNLTHFSSPAPALKVLFKQHALFASKYLS